MIKIYRDVIRNGFGLNLLLEKNNGKYRALDCSKELEALLEEKIEGEQESKSLSERVSIFLRKNDLDERPFSLDFLTREGLRSFELNYGIPDQDRNLLFLSLKPAKKKLVQSIPSFNLHKVVRAWQRVLAQKISLPFISFCFLFDEQKTAFLPYEFFTAKQLFYLPSATNELKNGFSDELKKTLYQGVESPVPINFTSFIINYFDKILYSYKINNDNFIQNLRSNNIPGMLYHVKGEGSCSLFLALFSKDEAVKIVERTINPYQGKIIISEKLRKNNFIPFQQKFKEMFTKNIYSNHLNINNVFFKQRMKSQYPGLEILFVDYRISEMSVVINDHENLGLFKIDPKEKSFAYKFESIPIIKNYIGQRSVYTIPIYDVFNIFKGFIMLLTQKQNDIDDIILDVNSYLSELLLYRTLPPSDIQHFEKKRDYKNLIEFFPDALLLMRLDGTINDLNAEAIRLMKLKDKKDVTGHNFKRYIHSEDRNLVQRIYRDVYQSDKPIKQSLSQEFRLIRNDGKVIFVSARTSLILEDDGSTRGIILLFHDISLQKIKRKEQILRHDMALALAKVSSLDGAMNIALNTSISLSRMDCGGIFIKQAQYYELFTSEGALGCFLNKIALRQDNFSLWDQMEEGCSVYLEDEDPRLKEFNLLGCSNVRSAALISIHAIHGIWGFFCLVDYSSTWIPDELRHTLETLTAQVSGVVNRLETEEKLKKSEALYRSLISTMPSSLVLYSDTGSVLKFNQSAQNIFQFDKMSKSQLAFTEGWNLTDQEGRTLPLEEYPYMKTLRTGQPLRNTVLGLPRKDEVIWLAANSEPLFEDNKLESVVVVYRDITENRKALIELNAAKIEAEQASKSKSIFLSNMSHEIRTPISGIIGLTDLLSEKVREEELQEDLLLIRQAENTLLDIINNVLDISRIESGKMVLHFHPFSVQDLIKKLIFTISPQCRKKGLKLESTIDPKIPKQIWGDSAKLNQILMNLLGNAVKFTDKGTISIRISLSDCSDQNRVKLLFSVVDTGIGIDPSQYDKIFDNFFQLENSYSKSYQGTGLGLSISQNLVKLMNGDIRVLSHPKEGSTFIVSLSFALRGEDSDNSELLINQSNETYSILLAEDNLLNQRAVCFFLQKEGHHVDCAENGLIVLDKLKTDKKYDLILMDIQMPEMEGLEAMRHIRNTPNPPWNPNIPIIALTAFAMKEDCERFISEGMNGYVAKPINMNGLMNEISRVKGSVVNKMISTEKVTKSEKLNKEESSFDSDPDIKSFLKFYDGDEETEMEIIELFLETKKLIQEVHFLIASDRITDCAPLFHVFTNNLSGMCQRSMGKLSRQLEQYCLKDQKILLKEEFPIFENKMKSLIAFFEKLLGELHEKLEKKKNLDKIDSVS